MVRNWLNLLILDDAFHDVNHVLAVKVRDQASDDQKILSHQRSSTWLKFIHVG